MKIIFLDFDGPLSNTRVTLAAGNDDIMDPVAAQAINHICEATGAKIVCTSVRTWAHSRSSYRETAMFFEQAGLDIRHLHPDWSCRMDHGKRKTHILKWLAAHPGVTHYAIVDDENVRLPNLVKVDLYNGIRFRDYEKIAKCLDFDLIEAFNEARSKRISFGQFVLPFEAHDDYFNQNLIERTPS